MCEFKRRMSRGMSVVTMVCVATSLYAGGPTFRLDFRCPDIVSGQPGETLQFGATSVLETRGLRAGERGAQGWTLGVTADGNGRIVDATTSRTAAARARFGGFRLDGFEVTELIDPRRNGGRSGAVSAVILSNTGQSTLPPDSAHDILNLVVETTLDRQGLCAPSTLQYRSDLRGSGEMVPTIVTYEDRSFDPELARCVIQSCPLPCPRDGLLDSWPKSVIGDASGTAWQDGKEYKICASGEGYAAAGDGLVALGNSVGRGHFTMEATVVSVEGQGEASVEARLFTGTSPLPTSPGVRVGVCRDVRGGLQLVSSMRIEPAGKVVEFDPIPLRSLPVQLRLQRRGGRMAASFSEDGRNFRELQIFNGDEGFGNMSFLVAMTGSSKGRRVTPNRSLDVATSCFIDPRLSTLDPDALPPRLTRIPEMVTTPQVGKPTEVRLKGLNLDDIIEVIIAGEPGEVKETGDGEVLVIAPPFDRPVRGDIIVRTPNGSDVIPGGFFSYGKEWARCDCDGNGRQELTDAIRNLSFQFLGTPQCDCPQAGDCNGDGDQNLTDAIYHLSWMFLGGAPAPEPFPEPGPSPEGEESCGVESFLPTILDVSTRSIREGDVFVINGENFPDDPQQVAVVAGDAEMRVIQATPRQLTVQVDNVPGVASLVDLGVITDFLPTPINCFPKRCYPVFIGPAVWAEIRLELIPSRLDLITTSERDRNGDLILKIDPEALIPENSAAELRLQANLPLPAVNGISPGSRMLSFSPSVPSLAGDGGGAGLPGQLNRDLVLESLADQLQMELVAGSRLKDIIVIPEPESDSIRVTVSPELRDQLREELFFDGIISIFWTVGRCGPDNLHPIADERPFGWCRIEEITRKCNGLPAFEWWFSKDDTITADADPFPLKHPNDRSPGEKQVVYNRSAYCHIRKHALWNNCKLDELIADGFSSIPEFPKEAWVMKTSWSASLPAAADPDDFYSYTYTGTNTEYYLVALHHTTKDIRKWVWLDLYPPLQIGTLGGCGGTNSDVPANINAPFDKYFMCTNVTADQPISTSGLDGVGPTATENSAHCGNFRFAPECLPSQDGDAGDTCMRCHDGKEPSTHPCCSGATYNNSEGSLDLDFLFSLRNGLESPVPCETVSSVSFSADVLPILQANCGCHTGGGGSLPSSLNLTGSAGTVFGQIVNQNSVQSGLDRIEPNNPNASYLWRKLLGTHGSVGSGSSMPPSGSLSVSQRNIIETWIDDGAPNN